MDSSTEEISKEGARFLYRPPPLVPFLPSSLLFLTPLHLILLDERTFGK
jgi:hypothetical protein